MGEQLAEKNVPNIVSLTLILTTY